MYIASVSLTVLGALQYHKICTKTLKKKNLTTTYIGMKIKKNLFIN